MLTSMDKYRAKKDMRLITQQITTVISSKATCPTCGFNEFTQSGIKSDCLTCNGTGKVIVDNKIIIRARISWPNLTDVIVGIVGVVESGDLILYTEKRNREHIVLVKDSGYILIGSDRYAIKSISVAGLGENHELSVLCSRQSQ